MLRQGFDSVLMICPHAIYSWQTPNKTVILTPLRLYYLTHVPKSKFQRQLSVFRSVGCFFYFWQLVFSCSIAKINPLAQSRFVSPSAIAAPEGLGEEHAKEAARGH
jgi:hypothetical protein